MIHWSRPQTPLQHYKRKGGSGEYSITFLYFHGIFGGTI